MGRDTPDFAVTLRSIMRQTPDVILVGEMRDAETMATVLTAAETGHLVFSTLHTNDAIQAVSRILDSFPAANQPQIRQQISLALAAVVAQQLVPGVDGGRALAGDRDHDRHRRRAALIRKGDDHQFARRFRRGGAEGMMTMEQSLAELVRAGASTAKRRWRTASGRTTLQRYLFVRTTALLSAGGARVALRAA